MSTIILGCDKNNSNDSKWQNTVANALEKEGHKVEKLQIVSWAFADYSYKNKAKGKIGIYIMADSLVSVADLAFGNTQFKYAYFLIRGDLGRPKMDSMSDFKNNPIGRDSDCTSICDKLAGKTYPQMNEICKNKCQITFGTSATEGANNLIKLMGGNADVSSSKKSSSSTSSSIKESLKKAVSKWNGDVEIRLIEDTVHVRKIPDPSTTKLSLNEFTNVIYDSITVTDVHPTTINHLSMDFKDYTLTLKDDTLIKRFGKQSKKIKVDSSIKTLDGAKAFLQREFNKIRRDDGRQVELKITGNSNFSVGKWCRVYLPSYYIDDYMYITKASNDEDGSGNWNTSLTLVDYPPSFGTSTEEKKKSSEN